PPSSPSAFPNRPSRSPRPPEPLRLQPHCPCSACPGYAQPRCEPLRQAAAGAIALTTGGPWRRRGAGGAGRKCRLNFLLCCRCCQALLSIFLLPYLFWSCVTWPRSVWRLPAALGPSVSNDLLSVRVQTPVTRFSMRLSTRAGRPVEGDPIYPTASLQG